MSMLAVLQNALRDKDKVTIGSALFEMRKQGLNPDDVYKLVQAASDISRGDWDTIVDQADKEGLS